MGKDSLNLVLPLPEMDEINEEQQQKVRTFVDGVIEPMIAVRKQFLASRESDPNAPVPALDTMALDSYVSMTAENKDINAYKFLTARKWDAAKAEEMFKATMRFKHDSKLEECSVFPAAVPTRGYDDAVMKAQLGLKGPRCHCDADRVHDHLKSIYVTSYHKWDKWGHPVYYELLGKVHPKRMVDTYKLLAKPGEKPEVPASALHIHEIEVGRHLAQFQDETWGKANGRHVLGVVVVIDCEGLGMGQMYSPLLDIAKVVLKYDQEYYPECLHALYAVNCPGMIMFAWNIVKGWLDARIRHKVHFVKPERTTEVLLKVIDAENLPERYGGTCQCEEACIPGIDGTVTPPVADPSNFSQIFKVAPGAKVQKTATVHAGDAVVWDFVVDDDMHVEFCADFTPSSDPSSQTDIFMKSKVPHLSDRHIAREDGEVLFTFGNEHSWMRSKTVTLRLYVEPQTPPSE